MQTREIVLATGNPGKVRELQFLLQDSGLICRPQTEFNMPEAVEDGFSFVENALKKARNACKHTGLPAIADDSGIEVDALNGEPGIYSARYAGAVCNDADNWQHLLNKLSEIDDPQRGARFVCVMVYLRHARDPVPIICTGTWSGRILKSPRGDNGFGYDPVFFVPEHGVSAAELTAEQKNAISHRSKALSCLVDALTS